MDEKCLKTDLPRSPIIRVRRRKIWRIPLPKTEVAVGKITDVQELCVTKQAATPSCSLLRQNLMVQSPLVAETASMGEEANTPSFSTYCTAAEMICGNFEVAKENTQELMSLEFSDTYCSNADQLMKTETLTEDEDIGFSVDELKDSQSTACSNEADMATIDTQDYLQTQESHVNTQFSTSQSDTGIAKKRRGRKKKEASLETPPDSGSFLQSQKPRHSRRTRGSKHKSAKISRQARQRASVSLATSPPATQKSWSQHSISYAAKSSTLTRSSQKDAKEEVSNLVDCVRAIRKQVRSWVIEGDNNSNKSQVLQDVANIVQQAHQLQNKYGETSDLEHVLQACEAITLQLRYVPHQHKSKPGKGATHCKRQIVSKQDDIKVKDTIQDMTNGLPSLFDLVNANILQPGRMNLCLLIRGCLPMTASISKEGHILSSSGVMYETVENWCQDWTKDLSIFRKQAYTYTYYCGQSIMSLCPDSMIHKHQHKTTSKENKRNIDVNSIEEMSSPSLLSSTKLMKQVNESRKKLEEINIPYPHQDKVIKHTALVVKDDVTNFKTKKQDPSCTSLEKTELTHSQSDADTYFSGASYSPQNSPASFGNSPYERSPSLKSSDSENDNSDVKKDTKINVTEKDKTMERSVPVIFNKSNKKTVVNEIETAKQIQCSLTTVDVKHKLLPSKQLPVKQENRTCPGNPQETKHEPPRNSDPQKRKLSDFKIADTKFAKDVGYNGAKASNTELNNHGTIQKSKTAGSVNQMPQLVPSFKSHIAEDIVMKSEEKKCTEIKSPTKEEFSLKRLNQEFIDKVDKEPPKSPKINTSMSPNDLLKLKAKSISLLKKLDNDEVPSINDFANVKQVKCESQLNTGNEVQCNETQEKPCTGDITCEDEQEAWRVKTKAKMLAKWNAEVQGWGNPEPSQVKTPVHVQPIPHFTPAYKSREKDSQNHESTIQVLEQLAVMMRNVQDMVSQLSQSSSSTYSSQKFNTPSQQHASSPIPKTSMLKSYSQSEDASHFFDQEFCGGSQGAYSKSSNWESSNPRLRQRISFSQIHGSQDGMKSQNLQATHVPSKPIGGSGNKINKTPLKYTPKKSTASSSSTKQDRVPFKCSFMQTGSVPKTPNKPAISKPINKTNNTLFKNTNLTNSQQKFGSNPFDLKTSFTRNNIKSNNTPNKQFSCVSTEIKITPDNKSNTSFEAASQWIGEDSNWYEQQHSQGNKSETKSCTEKNFLNEFDPDDWSSQPLIF